MYRLARKAETHFGAPQDIEWTFRNGALFVLQSRPITTGGKERADDVRTWYLSLRRSLDNLKNIRVKIEDRLIPKMIEDADRMEEKDMDHLSDIELADEIGRRRNRLEYWMEVYWNDFIPFAHGMRLFGQVYNDTVSPDDPFEFMNLLGTKNLKSIERNRLLKDISRKIRQHPEWDRKPANSFPGGDPELDRLLNLFIEKLGIPLPSERNREYAQFIRNTIAPFINEMADSTTSDPDVAVENTDTLTSSFLSFFEEENRENARELLDLGRASYRLRDDDNLYLGRIENLLKAAIEFGKDRIAQRGDTGGTTPESTVLIEMLEKPVKEFNRSLTGENKGTNPSIRARQIVGQPAGPGIARGKARVIFRQSDLFAFKKGEVLVCDALDPEMTFVIPLSAGIVERRGGMLIHGAIIAREYGLPCVTGVARATELIKTGQEITLDGHLGIVIVG
ncbi:MAG: PEP-utilizing enzyme [Acidobacteriota bacterium]